MIVPGDYDTNGDYDDGYHVVHGDCCDSNGDNDIDDGDDNIVPGDYDRAGDHNIAVINNIFAPCDYDISGDHGKYAVSNYIIQGDYDRDYDYIDYGDNIAHGDYDCDDIGDVIFWWWWCDVGLLCDEGQHEARRQERAATARTEDARTRTWVHAHQTERGTDSSTRLIY